MELDLRWKRVGRNGDESNTEKREKVGKSRTSAEPVRLSGISNLHVLSSMAGKERERDRRMGEGPRKWIEKSWARRGRQVQFLTVSHWSPVPSSMPGMTREREGRVNIRENEKDDRKLALVRGVVAKERKIEEQKIEKRWARRGRLLSLFGYLPFRICMSLLRCPEKEKETEGWGKGQESG